MKTIKQCICLLCGMILMLSTSCDSLRHSDNEQKPAGNISSEEQSNNDLEILEQGQKEQQQKISSELTTENYQDIITVTVNAKNIYDKYLFQKYNYYISAKQPYLTDFRAEFPAECIRSIDKNNIYVVNRLDDGRLFYSFFTIEHNSSEWDFNCTAVCEKSLKYEQFKDVKKGTSIKDIQNIDPVTELYFNRFKNMEKNHFSKHLLKDGLLVLKYEKISDDEFVVSGKEYYENFLITDNLTEDGFLFDANYSYKIRPEDYPE